MALGARPPSLRRPGVRGRVRDGDQLVQDMRRAQGRRLRRRGKVGPAGAAAPGETPSASRGLGQVSRRRFGLAAVVLRRPLAIPGPPVRQDMTRWACETGPRATRTQGSIGSACAHGGGIIPIKSIEKLEIIQPLGRLCRGLVRRGRASRRRRGPVAKAGCRTAGPGCRPASARVFLAAGGHLGRVGSCRDQVKILGWLKYAARRSVTIRASVAKRRK
jgi:hypothetical protein